MCSYCVSYLLVWCPRQHPSYQWPYFVPLLLVGNENKDVVEACQHTTLLQKIMLITMIRCLGENSFLLVVEIVSGGTRFRLLLPPMCTCSVCLKLQVIRYDPSSLGRAFHQDHSFLVWPASIRSIRAISRCSTAKVSLFPYEDSGTWRVPADVAHAASSNDIAM